MKIRKSLILLVVMFMLLTPIAASAAVGVINVTDGGWDGGWGPSLGASATVDGYYVNVDAPAPGVGIYYFGIDKTTPFPSFYAIEIYLDCDRNGSFFDAVDFMAGFQWMFTPPQIAPYRQNGDGSNADTTTPFLFEIVGAGDQMEIEVPITGQDISQCVNSSNNVWIRDGIGAFDTGTNGAGPNAIDLQSFSARENSSLNNIPWLIGAAVAAAGMIVFLQVRRKKSTMQS